MVKQMILSDPFRHCFPGYRKEVKSLFAPANSPFFVFALCLLLLAPSLAVSAENPSLSQQPVAREKATGYMTARARSFLEDRDGRVVRAWVFFTDKGFSSQREFDQRAAAVALTSRAMKRRAKVGIDKVVFVDIPVASQYVDQIISLGARHRRSSRILNAASFEIPVDRLDQIGALPFVAEIRPLATSSGPPEIPVSDSARPETAQGSLAGEALDYGPSYAQLNQINVPAVHDRGFTGAGVTLAIMDDGFRKTHEAFATAVSENRILGEWDFINNDGNTANEGSDASNQWSHGTRVWSVAGGASPGHVYGPAYGANFILCKTEDETSETPVEEDNWVAALEFADSIGTDVINTSLGYLDWYITSDFDGKTAVITIAANTCDGLGIVMCNSAGNYGYGGVTTITPPADAYDILAVGNVDSDGNIATSSSRGPTYDTGDPNDPPRIKPEVCARGTNDNMASWGSDSTYTIGSGTSFASPLVAGSACLVVEAHPDWTPYQVRQALKLTADNALSPNNTYGWGLIDANAAIDWDGSGACCEGVLGNINCVGQIDITDLQVFIDNQYLSLAPLCCEAEGDLDSSGSVDLTDIQLMLDHLFLSLQPFPGCP